jgi:hypothetical protein
MGVKVSRQRYYNDEAKTSQLAVELCFGTKCVGEDMLTARYPSEGKYLTMPEDALKIGLTIHKQWSKDYTDERTFVSVVNADGAGGMETFDPSAKKDLDKLKKLIETATKNLEKCSYCQKPMGNRSEFSNPDLKGVFCAEVCIANKYRNLYGVEIAKDAIIMDSGKAKASGKKTP